MPDSQCLYLGEKTTGGSPSSSASAASASKPAEQRSDSSPEAQNHKPGPASISGLWWKGLGDDRFYVLGRNRRNVYQFFETKQTRNLNDR
ncbi:hypothetical protein BO78DRAFT_162989 [Aspergillus sclerotiicarbonarius CBS 121057]|uniref:Uncharacterized protein n=1 Tax=Aspergillus sclerotiicarbonarius (strain CBS 121057 / IBT 28362) TaxID=1448318 RepID=A0A319ELG2_ASPSB|nr:hypothetical protein BO78DRAFT_162989 [Aspergillus sclerotiicarbonarius CBS 121057]